ncbi:hypothetical protein A2U01_0012263 [Trifolium medium]|uniref:Uncharacterized protein n=1 Tax=Trifolium medium TaxID=97028 RepID=A0A392MUW5_9FABA|nr:hypothetical protein [Trifolium medium]
MTDEVGRQRRGRESRAHSSARREAVNVDRIPRRAKGKGVAGQSQAQREPEEDSQPQHEPEAEHVDEVEVEVEHEEGGDEEDLDQEDFEEKDLLYGDEEDGGSGSNVGV